MSRPRSSRRQADPRAQAAPRQRLIETELAERYGTTRFVLRKALTRLAGEGLVELQPNIDAVCARDPEAAERAMRAHLTNVLAALAARSVPTPALEAH